MHDDTIKKLALTGVIIGIVGLFLIDIFTAPEEMARPKIEDTTHPDGDAAASGSREIPRVSVEREKTIR